MIYLGTSHNKSFEYYYSDSKIIIFKTESLMTQMYFICIPEVQLDVSYDGLFFRDESPKEKIILTKGLSDEYVKELLFNVSIVKLL